MISHQWNEGQKKRLKIIKGVKDGKRKGKEAMKPCVVSDREGFPEPKVTKSPKPKRVSRSWNQNVFDNN